MNVLLSQDPVLKDFLDRIGAVRHRIHQATVFGSRARGTHQFDSDYDLLLVVPKKDEVLLDTLYEAVIDVLLAHGRLISLKIYEEQEFARLQALQTPFMRRVVEEGVPLG